MVGLLRVGGKLADSLAVCGLYTAELGSEGGLGIVERVDNGAPQIVQGNIEVADQRVLLTGVGDQVVTFQQLLVVRGYLCLHSGIADAGAGGQQLLGMGGIGDIVADITYHIELVVEHLTLLVGSTLLSHGLSCYRHDIGHGIGTLVSGNVLIHIAQLLLYDSQTLLDELIGGDANLVAVFDPVLVVDIDDGLEDVLSTGNGVVDTADINNVLGIGLQGGTDNSSVPACRCHKTYTLD